MQKLIEINLEYKNKVLSLISVISNSIRNLPTNTKVKKIGSNIQILNFKDLDNSNWTPEFYNFEWQYNEVIRDIENCSVLKLENYIENLLKSGTIKRYNKNFKLHPVVLSNISNCLN